jgi:hypothetical protein
MTDRERRLEELLVAVVEAAARGDGLSLAEWQERLVHADAQQRRADQEEALRKERDAAATTEAALRPLADRDRGAAEQAQARAEKAEQKNARFLMNAQLARVAAVYERDPDQAPSRDDSLRAGA